MAKETEPAPPSLYEADETAWLELTARLITQGRFSEVDLDALAEYLTDMARRDRREVATRLTVLLEHLLKWQHQPAQRTNSWRRTIIEQRHELEDCLDSGTLLNHAHAVLAKSYGKAVKQAAADTGLPVETFPKTCPYSIDWLLTDELQA